MGLRADLDGCGKSRPNRIPSPDCRGRSESLYWPAVPAVSRQYFYTGNTVIGRKKQNSHCIMRSFNFRVEE